MSRAHARPEPLCRAANPDAHGNPPAGSASAERGDLADEVEGLVEPSEHRQPGVEDAWRIADQGEGKDLSPEVLGRIRTVKPKETPTGVICTDLASVPGPTRWFLGRYGEHTPAVIIHDEPIPTPPDLPGMTDARADRYLRFMLADLGVRLLKRRVTWAAVALRSRFAAGGWRRWLVVVWLVAAAVGITTFGLAWANGDARLMWLSAAAPALFAGLWGRQYGAGLVAAITAPWLPPPTVLALLGYLVYLALEWIGDQIVHALVRLGLVAPEIRDTGTYVPRGF